MRPIGKIIDEDQIAIENSMIYREAARRREETNKPSTNGQDQAYAAFAAHGMASYPIERRVTSDGKTVEVDTLVSVLAPIISRARTFCGGSFEKGELEIMCQQVAGDLRMNYGSFHLAEFEEACRLGQREEFGEVYGADGVNAKAVINWMKRYTKEGYHARYLASHMPEIPKLQQPEGLATASSLQKQYELYIKTKLHAQVVAAKAKAEANGEEYVDMPGDEDEDFLDPGGVCLFQTTFRGADGKRKRSHYHPLWDFDGWAGKEGSNARLLNQYGYPGKDLEAIFEWCIAHGVKTLRDDYGYLKTL